jgi:hypothetical protein
VSDGVSWYNSLRILPIPLERSVWTSAAFHPLFQTSEKKGREEGGQKKGVKKKGVRYPFQEEGGQVPFPATTEAFVFELAYL